MQKTKLNIFLVLIIGIGVFSCKEPDVVGLDILPDGDQLGLVYSDTFSITAFTVREDSIRTNQTSPNLVGSYVDPVFGVVKASFFTQFLLPSNDISFGDQVQLDSIVLTLRYFNYYGKVKKLGNYQTFKVYRQTEAFDNGDTTDYYSNKLLEYDANEIGSITTLPSPIDSVLVGGKNEAPQLRVKLSNSFGEEILNSASLTNNDAFTDEFKGLYVSSDNPNQVTGDGAVLYFNLLSNDTKVTIYYSNSEEDSLEFDLPINSDAKRAGYFEHDYSNNTEIISHLADTTLGSSKFYLQSLAGLNTKIYFPTLLNILDSGEVSINKAELIMSLDETIDNTFYSPPSTLALVRIDDDGERKFLTDNVQGTDYFGGTLTSSNKYRFNIAFYVQELLNGKFNDNGLYLLNSGSAVNANRCVIQGPDTNNVSPMKLVLTYTKLN